MHTKIIYLMGKKGYEPLITRKKGEVTHFTKTCDRIKKTNAKYLGESVVYIDPWRNV